MNVYDTVNQLASELNNSEEYVNYKMAKQVINMNMEFKKKIQEFEKARYEVQILEMQTGKRDEEKLNQVQEMYKELIEFEEIRKYFDAELKFNVLLGDVNKIISEAVKDIFMD